MRQKSAEEREAYVAQQIAMRNAKRLAQQLPQPQPVDVKPLDQNVTPPEERKAQIKAIRQASAKRARGYKLSKYKGPWSLKPMTCAERQRKHRAKLSAQQPPISA